MENSSNSENSLFPKDNLSTDSGKIKYYQEQVENKNLEIKKLNKKIEDLEGINLLRPDKTFGLNVSGDVLLNKMEVEIVDTVTFQRLAYVNQLGSTNSVYRSANHTRFEHSLGVLKMADMMIQKITNNKHSEPNERDITAEQKQIIRLLALLHDIGHMPFGHTIEDEFHIFPSHDKHESRWDRMLGQSSEIGKIIIKHINLYEKDEKKGIEFHDKFFKLIKCEKNFNGLEDDAFMYDIVSDTVCADLLDYLARDCQYTNLKLNFHPRFLDYFIIKKVINPDSGNFEKRIVMRLCKRGKNEPRKDILSELVQLLRNRYYLGERVYYHHTKIKTGTLIAGAVMRAKEGGFFKYLDGYDDKRIYQVGDAPLYDIHTWGDVKLLVKLEDMENRRQGENSKLLNGAKKLAKAFINREIYFELSSKGREDFPLNENNIEHIEKGIIDEKDMHVLEMKLYQNFSNAKNRLQREDFLSEQLPGMESGDFLLYFPSYKMQMKLAKLKIEDDSGLTKTLSEYVDTAKECSHIITKHKKLWKLRAFIHPKFIKSKNHPEYREEYDKYGDIAKSYCNSIFAKNDEDEKHYLNEFWRKVINLQIDTNLISQDSKDGYKIYNPVPNKEKKIKNRTDLVDEIAQELVTHTKLDRSSDSIKELIKNSFTENHQKSGN